MLLTILSSLKKLFNFKKGKSGFSIIEVMVAVGLLAIIATGISSLLTSTMKQQKGIQAKDQQRDFTARVRTLLNNKTACLNSMGGKLATGDGEDVDPLKDETGATKFKVGDLDTSKMLKITSMRVRSADTTMPTQITALFQVFLTKTDDKTSTANALRPDTITLRVKLDGANRITECFSIGTNSDGLWQISPYNTSDIYYSAGNVGIGTDKPNSPLEVVFDNLPADSRNDLLITRYNNNNDWSPINFRRYRGTPSTPQNIVAGDELGGILDVGMINGALTELTFIRTRYTGDGVNRNSLMEFATGNAVRMVLDESGNLSLNSSSNASSLSLQPSAGRSWNVSAFNTNRFGIGYYNSSPPTPSWIWDMTIDSSGNVGIGTTAPESRLHVAGNVQGDAFYWSSDARLKNILSVSPGLDMINKMNGYSFEWKKNGQKDLGFMAQEIEKLLPELVTTDSKGYKHLSYTGIIPVLVEAVKELDQKNKNLESRLDALEKKLNNSH